MESGQRAGEAGRDQTIVVTSGDVGSLSDCKVGVTRSRWRFYTNSPAATGIKRTSQGGGSVGLILGGEGGGKIQLVWVETGVCEAGLKAVSPAGLSSGMSIPVLREPGCGPQGTLCACP